MSGEIHDNYIPGGALDHYVKDESGDTWYPTGQVFEAWATGGRDATDYAVAMVGDAGGNFVGDFDVNIPAGHYYPYTKIRAGASAADGDVVKGSGEIWWSGSAEQTETAYYDGPTNAEMEARTLVSSGYATATVANAIKVTTDRLSGMIVLDGAVYQFTENALELTPSDSDTVNWTIQATIS